MRGFFPLPVSRECAYLTSFFHTSASIKHHSSSPGPISQPSLKDYVLVKERMMSSVLDTRVHRVGDMNSAHRLTCELSVRRVVKEGKWLDGVMKRLEDDM